MAIQKMSEDTQVELIATADIGGTEVASPWMKLADFERFYAKFKLIATWTDAITTAIIEQAQDAVGTGAKAITTSASGGDYNTDTPINAAGETVVLECRNQDLDANNEFTHVRARVAATGNTGVDNVVGVAILWKAHYNQRQREADAVAGATMYVSPVLP